MSGQGRAAAAPEDLARLLVERVNAGDLDGVVALYEAITVSAAGKPALDDVRGRSSSGVKHQSHRSRESGGGHGEFGASGGCLKAPVSRLRLRWGRRSG